MSMRITRINTMLECEVNGVSTRVPLGRLPSEFIEWQIEERRKTFNLLKGEGRPTFLAPHLPTLITVNPDTPHFPINAASKGVGLVPEPSEMPEIVTQLGQTASRVKGKDFFSTLKERISAAELFYASQKIDVHSLGGLEIFEGTSFSNMTKNPFVSLFFVGGAPSYKSFQVNCVAEIVEKGHPFYQFVASMRALFEEGSFHFQQPAYPYAIHYHVSGVLDKSLKIRK
ncbi:MAG: hypothetical protein HXS40_10615 [Theionarchaea archaeon]|nr:hypothetical protein [Theionarchaea archaeon]